MIYNQEKVQELNWAFIQKRFEGENEISPSFISHLEEIFLGIKPFDVEDFEDFHVKEVFHYLKVSHTVYLDVLLPKIENTLYQLCIKHGGRNISLNILLVFIEKYKTQLVNHIMHEEQVLFRFVDQLLKGEYSRQNKNFVMTHFLHTHNDNIILSLDELKGDFMMFDEELKSNLAFQVLFDQLNCFQHDLVVHGLIEDQVFIHKILAYISDHFETAK